MRIQIKNTKTPSIKSADSAVIIEKTTSYNIGYGLKVDDKTNTLSVDTTNDVEEGNLKPITSAGVFATVGNIDELLKTI